MLGSLTHLTRQLIVYTSPSKRSSDFVAQLEHLDELRGLKPNRPAKRSYWCGPVSRRCQNSQHLERGVNIVADFSCHCSR